MAPHPGRHSNSKGINPRPNGVLPLHASTVPKDNVGSMENRPTRIAAPRLKLVVRRLPPGLPEQDFQTALGAEWKVGAGKVDWLVYKAGKTSKE